MADAIVRALISRLSSAYFLSRCLHAVVELGIADALGDAPVPIAVIASRVGAEPTALKRVLLALAATGVFEISDEHLSHSMSSRLQPFAKTRRFRRCR